MINNEAIRTFATHGHGPLDRIALGGMEDVVLLEVYLFSCGILVVQHEEFTDNKQLSEYTDHQEQYAHLSRP